MREIILDGRLMTSRDAAHDLLFEALGLPAYYGRNLDALYDCLTEMGEPTQVVVVHAKDMVEALGMYGTLLVRVLEDSAYGNENLRVMINE